MKATKITTSEHTSKEVSKGHKTRVYVWPKGETILKNLENRRDRPYNAYRPIITPIVKGLIESVLPNANIERIGWSQTAGCSCGCSPGFVVYGVKPHFDIHITIE